MWSVKGPGSSPTDTYLDACKIDFLFCIFFWFFFGDGEGRDPVLH
jgi:hypothetical protein